MRRLAPMLKLKCFSYRSNLKFNATMILSEVCIKRPVFASVMSLLIIVVGIMFYGRLEIRGIPDISPPIITVTANYEGADAAYMEQNVTMRIEKILRTVKNVDSIKSTSEPEKANIMIIFKLSTDINEAMSDVRSKIAEVSDFLPKGMKLPIVQKMDFSAQPSIYMSATSDRHDDMELTAILYRTTIRALEKIDSVGHVQPFGAKFYNMQITPDPASMYALKITPIDIEMAIRAQNKDYPAGSIKTDVNSFVLKLGGALNKVEEFENIILRSDKNGMIKLSQVAKVALAPLEDEMRARYNGTQTVAMGLTKQSNSNILKMSAEVREALPQMQKELPAGVKLYIAYDAAVPVDASINSVYMTIFEALVLVVGVVYLFLQSAPLTLIPFVTIPVSLIGTFTFMYFLGFSINTFTLLAMILAIGLVVDDAIVMLENIFRHHQENGSSGQEAAITGSHEIGFTILAMTITLAAVFLPVGFDSGFLGKIFIEFAWTLAFCVLVSGFVALTLTPMMAARMIRSNASLGLDPKVSGVLGDHQVKPEGKSFGFQLFLSRATNLYLNNLGFLMTHAKRFWIMCASSVVILIISMMFVTKAFAPDEDAGYLFVSANGPEGSSTQHTDDALRKIETILSQHKDVAGYFTAAFGGERAFAFIPLKPWSERSKSAQQIQAELNKRFREVPEISTFAMAPQELSTGPPDEKSVEFYLSTSDEWGVIDALSTKALRDMKESGIFSDPERDLKTSTPTLDINVDRDRAYLYGLSMESIGTTLQYLIAGRNVGDFRMDNETYEVTMRYAKDDRDKISDLSKIYLKSNSGQLIYLDTIADIKEEISIKDYKHKDNLKAVKMSAGLSEGKSVADAIKFIEKWARDNMDSKFSFEFAGQIKQMNEANANILLLFGLALVFIYLVLAAQFESWKDPLIILCAVPFSITGGVFALLIAGSSLNLYSNIGLVTLIGLITKNSIMIVEFANQLYEKGISRIEAVTEAAQMRFRPILMTTMATIAGALPLAFASGAGAGARNSIGIVIVGGMLLGTLFTIFVIPVLYKVFKS